VRLETILGDIDGEMYEPVQGAEIEERDPIVVSMRWLTVIWKCDVVAPQKPREGIERVDDDATAIIVEIP
jgi:hypothetical protein